jgi:F0F1-type ATP synthase assembly protein I
MGERTDGDGGPSGLRYVGVGVGFAAYTTAGWFAGRWVDDRCGYAPWGATVGVLLGITLAVWDLLRLSAALERADREKKR